VQCSRSLGQGDASHGCWPKNRLLSHHVPEGWGALKAEAFFRPCAWRKADGFAFAGWDRANAFNHKGLLGNNAEASPDPLVAMGGGAWQFCHSR
jgi:hypothetical protein